MIMFSFFQLTASQVAGESLRSDRVSFGDVHTPKAAEENVERYPRGKAVIVYYDPDNPQNALLEPGLTLGTFAPGLFILVFGSMGVFAYRFNTLFPDDQ